MYDHPINFDKKICSMQGNALDIDVALRMIKEKFPEGEFVDQILEQIPLKDKEAFPPYQYEFDIINLSLTAGINNRVGVLHIVKPNWLFIYRPHHSTYPYWRSMEDNMTMFYNNDILITNSAKGK